MTYLLTVMATTMVRAKAVKPYRVMAARRQRKAPCGQDLLQNVDTMKGRLKIQFIRSQIERLIMNIAVALRTWNKERVITY